MHSAVQPNPLVIVSCKAENQLFKTNNILTTASLRKTFGVITQQLIFTHSSYRAI